MVAVVYLQILNFSSWMLEFCCENFF